MRGSVSVVAACLLTLAACGNDGRPSAAAATVTATTPATTAAPTTAAPTTTHPPTTTTTTSPSATTTSTSVAPTTIAATTVPATLPNPEAPPADPNAAVPVVQVGTIEIPRINVTKSMFEGVSLTTLDHGPGHWPGTAMPGQQGNVVVAGHRVSHDQPFRHIDELQPGDDVIFTTDAGRFVYRVVSTEVVQPTAIWIVDQTADFTGTLFACHPAGSTRQRIVVHLAYAPDA